MSPTTLGKQTARPLYFLHIPKTAGISLTAILESRFDAELICPAHLWHDLMRIPRGDLKRYRLFRGHFYSYLSQFLERGLTHLTMLRDPVERSISHFEHVRRAPEHYFHRKASSQTLAEFVSNPETRPMIEDFQTRAVAQDLDPRPFAAGLSRASLEALTLERLYESTMPSVSAATLLARAKTRLDEYAFVGLVERFEDSIRLICAVLGLPQVDSLPALNVSSNRADREAIPLETLELIRERTQLDAALYEHAQSLFEIRLKQIGQVEPLRGQELARADAPAKVLEENRHQLDQLRQRAAELQSQVLAMHYSKSWRITAPLRAVVRWARAAKNSMTRLPSALVVALIARLQQRRAARDMVRRLMRYARLRRLDVRPLEGRPKIKAKLLGTEGAATSSSFPSGTADRPASIADAYTDDQLCFIHIPKTGGNTLTPLIEENFAPHEICDLPAWYELPNYPVDLASYKLIRGHIYFSIGRILPSKPIYITMIRDPVERTISHYEMMRRLPTDPMHPRVKHMSFKDFVEDPHLRSLIKDVQTRFIGSDFDIRTLEDIKNTREDIDQIDVNRAKRHLESFAFVGLTERFRDSIRLLNYTFGWKPTTTFQSHNVAPEDRLRREKIPLDVLSRVEELTRLDHDLYEFGKRIFEERLSAMLDELLGEHYDRSYAERVFPLTDSLSYDFGEPIVGSGWHVRQEHPVHGNYRWLGPTTRATLALPLMREKDLLIRISAIAALSREIMASLQLKAGNHFIRLERKSGELGVTLFEGMIPEDRHADPNSHTVLTFSVSRTLSPNEIDPKNPDDRMLGIAVGKLEITPKINTSLAS